MNHRIGTSIIAAMAALGLAACSGTPGESTTPGASVEAPATDTTTTAETGTESASADPTTQSASADPSADSDASTPAGTDAQQPVADACASMSGPLEDASKAIADIASVGTADPQVAVDTWTKLVEAYRTAADIVVNPEVKAAASAVQEDATKMRDAIQKVYVDQDMSEMGDVTEATTEFGASMAELQALCTG
ncbi:hypothetical protein H5392_02675 [Tessaracoccus sp. MC1865]|uniref:hypothetical protein n=1 Tax=Tessaracoccus sp. MC1865 TaxID=2760310 RepID=UPI0016027E6D|nr:hypothetical protein [Tessaracoccus sp. MC1865]MBB1482765.1 hypothetical protein [Tessaracoccus sp. MC1865]QTO37789.1 hypothetical protein J7D54_01415 [Tessaracoccus sp. MC1865]